MRWPLRCNVMSVMSGSLTWFGVQTRICQPNILLLPLCGGAGWNGVKVIPVEGNWILITDWCQCALT